MRKWTTCTLVAVLALMYGCSTVKTATAEKKPLKIYIMAGQSNMQGKAHISTIPRMALSPESKDLHDKLVDKEGKPRVLDNTYMVYFTGSDGKKGPYELSKTQGKFTVFNGTFGPEFGFGITMDEKVDEPILIIKIAWGGRNLHGDFRPPSAGPKMLDQRKVESWKKAGIYEKKIEEFKKGGNNYRLMVKHIREVLADPGKYHPAYDKAAGYKVAGFVWFQGYNDVIGPYPKADPNNRGRRAPKDYSEYSRLMACFIRDVRKEVKTPDMPFVIGVMGLGGNTDGAFQMAQAAPALMPEFKGNVAAVLTGKYWDHDLEAACERVDKANSFKEATYRWTKDGKRDRSHVPTPGWHPIGTPSPQERVWRYTKFKRDPKDHYRPLKEGEKGDARVFLDETPTEFEGWNKPGFDDSKWKKGLAPIGREAKKGGNKNVTINSPWGDGEILLMRSTFEFNPEGYIDFRLSRMVSRSHNVYLNGHKLLSYQWWQGGWGYKLWERLPEKTPTFFTKGTNVLAVYANTTDTESPCVVDVVIEGLTQEGKDNLIALRDKYCSARDREIAKGKSSQGYHYNGSAYTYSLIGEAFAKAMLEMEK